MFPIKSCQGNSSSPPPLDCGFCFPQKLHVMCHLFLTLCFYMSPEYVPVRYTTPCF